MLPTTIKAIFPIVELPTSPEISKIPPIINYPKFILMALWALCVLFFSGRSTVKDVVALLLGFAVALFFTLFGYFWTDRWADFMPLFRENLLSGEFLKFPDWSEALRWGQSHQNKLRVNDYRTAYKKAKIKNRTVGLGI